MRGRRSLEVLVDTTFLLPTLGIEVEEEAQEVIPLFRILTIYYMEVSLLEAAWKYVKLGADLKIFKQGLEAIRETYKLIIPDSEAFSMAMELHSLGHKDLIDNLLYSASRGSGIRFLTIDRDFISFLKEREWPADNIITPRDLKNFLRGSSGKY